MQRCQVDMGSLARGLGRDRRHYERVGTDEGTLMRHFLRPARAPNALPGSVPQRSTVAQLVACTGAVPRLPPADLGTLTRAVAVATVTVAADPHLLAAARATVKPVGLLACPHDPRAQDWTKPRSDGIKAMRTRLHARACRRPGVLPGTSPGLRLFGVREQDSARAPPERAGYPTWVISRLQPRPHDCV